jgi:uncharacterized membrane protein YczE
MDASNYQEPPPQFSLRTMLLAVVAISASLAITQFVGIATVLFVLVIGWFVQPVFWWLRERRRED